MGNKRSQWSKVWPPALVLAAGVGLWQAAASLGWADAWTLPSPASVAAEALKADTRERLAEHTGATLRLTMLGFAGGAAAGFALAALLHLLPGLRRGLSPLLILSQNVPMVVLAPIMTMLFGYGMLPKILLVMLVCFFPVTVATLGGLAGGDEALRNYMRMIGCGRWTLFWRLELPGAVTGLFSGLKIAASYSVLSATFAEMLSPKTGLGGFMVLSTRGYMQERAFAAVILIVALSLALYGLISLAERAFTRWRPRKEAAERDA